jgi:hypothetical protein
MNIHITLGQPSYTCQQTRFNNNFSPNAGRHRDLYKWVSSSPRLRGEKAATTHVAMWLEVRTQLIRYLRDTGRIE